MRKAKAVKGATKARERGLSINHNHPEVEDGQDVIKVDGITTVGDDPINIDENI